MLSRWRDRGCHPRISTMEVKAAIVGTIHTEVMVKIVVAEANWIAPFVEVVGDCILFWVRGVEIDPLISLLVGLWSVPEGNRGQN